ncbi:MAG: hypothetical protein U9N45_07880 [Gemmatimonadota bacterium]|nr:hypothetical protein [Gemmatimonadota bacterium]
MRSYHLFLDLEEEEEEERLLAAGALLELEEERLLTAGVLLELEEERLLTAGALLELEERLLEDGLTAAGVGELVPRLLELMFLELGVPLELGRERLEPL